MEFNFVKAAELMEMFGGVEADITVIEENGELIAYYTDYPEEGHQVLGGSDAVV